MFVRKVTLVLSATVLVIVLKRMAMAESTIDREHLKRNISLVTRIIQRNVSGLYRRGESSTSTAMLSTTSHRKTDKQRVADGASEPALWQWFLNRSRPLSANVLRRFRDQQSKL